MTDGSNIVIGQDSKVTVRFMIFIILQLVMMLGGWYSMSGQVGNLQERVAEIRTEVRDLQSANLIDRDQAYELKKQMAVLSEQTKQLRETVTLLIEQLGHRRYGDTVSNDKKLRQYQ